MKDIDKVFNDMNMVFNDMDKVFKHMEKVMETVEIQTGSKDEPWHKWFAWRPVKVKGKTKWMRFVYRKAIPKTYVTYDDWTRYEYGDLFDVLKDAK